MNNSMVGRIKTGTSLTGTFTSRPQPKKSEQDSGDVYKPGSGLNPCPSSNIKQLFELSQNRPAGGNWFDFIFAILKALGLLAETIQKIELPAGGTPFDENAKPVQDFVALANRMMGQIADSRDEHSVDKLLDCLEQGAWDVSVSKRAQTALAEVQSAARSKKLQFSETALQSAKRRAQSLEDAFKADLAKLKAMYEDLSATKRAQQRESFEAQLRHLQDSATLTQQTAQEQIAHLSAQVKQQSDLLKVAQQAAMAAKNAADQAVIRTHASMPSAKSTIREVSRHSRPAVSMPIGAPRGPTATERDDFTTIAKQAWPELKSASSLAAASAVMRDFDRTGILLAMPLHTRDVCLRTLWENLQAGHSLEDLISNLLAAS